jgi:hypothetical protein
MKKSQQIQKIGPKILEPTAAEIEKTIEKIANKYEIVIPRSDAIKFAKLAKELGWWLTVEKCSDSPESITDEMATEFKDLFSKSRGLNITTKEANRKARESLNLVISTEKERIASEMKTLLTKYK